MARTRKTTPVPPILPIQIVILRATLVMTFVITFLCIALASQIDLEPVEAKADQPGLAGQAEAVSAPVESPADTQPEAVQAGSDCLVSDRFPQEVLQWCDLITRYASWYGAEPNLVAAVIWFESGGNPLAYSHSGATGLMQVMPRDGLAASFQCANGPCFANRPSRAELEDPAFNIEYGVRMLVNLYDRTQSWREALYAYGPMDVGYSYADRVLALYQSYDN